MKLIIAADPKTGTEQSEYPVTSIDDLPLSVLVFIKRDTGMSQSEIGRIMAGLSDITPDTKPEDVADREDLMLALGLLVWIARRSAGETLTLEQACNFPSRLMSLVAEPGDEPPDPHLARPGSGPGGRPPQDRQRKKTSSKKSASA